MQNRYIRKVCIIYTVYNLPYMQSFEGFRKFEFFSIHEVISVKEQSLEQWKGQASFFEILKNIPRNSHLGIYTFFCYIHTSYNIIWGGCEFKSVLV